MKGREKAPIPRYHYKLAKVSGSEEAGRMETALRERLRNSGMSFFAICHQTGSCDVMGDSGSNPLQDAALANARTVAAEIKTKSKRRAAGA